jgi:hypothetical protein
VGVPSARLYLNKFDKLIPQDCSRAQLLAFTANLQVQLIGMEACSGARFLGRALRERQANRVLLQNVRR